MVNPLFIVGGLLLSLVESSLHITVYQSPLTYYDYTFVSNGEPVWAALSENAKEIEFSSKFQCQFQTLPFEFPYYSDYITKIGVTKLGFIYTGPYTNARLTELMHIAPLMNLYSLENGTVHQETMINDQGETFYVIQWSEVLNRNESATFQLQLHINGTVVFAYQNVSSVVLSQSVVSMISAFPWVLSSTSVSTSDMTYYQYEEISVEPAIITNNSAITLTRRKNCQDATNCTTCQEIGSTTEFSCQWCDALARCSDTFDSKYNQWQNECKTTIVTADECPTDTVLNETASLLSDSFWEEQIAAISAYLEQYLNSSTLSYDDSACNDGLFYNPYTGSCNDCIYCASEECQETCTESASQEQSRTGYSVKNNLKVKQFDFQKFRASGDPWKSAFIGTVCGVTVCMCFGLLFVCVKRRNYVQPGGMNWSREQGASVLDSDEKPLIYGSSAYDARNI